MVIWRNLFDEQVGKIAEELQEIAGNWGPQCPTLTGFSPWYVQTAPKPQIWPVSAPHGVTRVLIQALPSGKGICRHHGGLRSLQVATRLPFGVPLGLSF